jgi:hypothetical protein
LTLRTNTCIAQTVSFNVPSAAQEPKRMQAWPPVPAKMVPVGEDLANYEELLATDLVDGSLLSFRLSATDEASGHVSMPAGAAIKVPLRFAPLAGFRMTLRLPDGSALGVYAKVSSERPEPGAAVELPRWTMYNMAAAFETTRANIGEEMCIERCAVPVLTVAKVWSCQGHGV